MKKFIFLLTLSLTILSCEKAKIDINPEVPNWLKSRIIHDEEIIKINQQSGLEPAAWIRYGFKGSFYYEYVNGLSSAGPITYNYDGTTFSAPTIEYFNYLSERCCRYFVWKGPSFIDLWD